MSYFDDNEDYITGLIRRNRNSKAKNTIKFKYYEPKEQKELENIIFTKQDKFEDNQDFLDSMHYLYFTMNKCWKQKYSKSLNYTQFLKSELKHI